MEKKAKKLDFNALSGLLTLLIALIYGIQAYNLPRASIGNPMAPSLYPLGLAIVMLVLAGILLLRSDFKKVKESFESVKKESTDKDRLSWKMIFITTIASIGYGIVFEHLGYIISTFIFLEIILGITNGKEKWKINSIVAIAFSIAVYILFSKVLGISLPPIPYLYI